MSSSVEIELADRSERGGDVHGGLADPDVAAVPDLATKEEQQESQTKTIDLSDFIKTGDLDGAVRDHILLR
jgi:hypothetical protein